MDADVVESGGKFQGASDRGDFQEAVANAIAAAKNGLKTDFVRWKLVDVSGQNGGFVLVDEITVTIQAQGPGHSVS